jgi:predicted Holliday junction resolvase-like endonuclease
MIKIILAIIIILFLIYSIYKKIKNLDKPFDEKKFIVQYQNQKKLKQKVSLPNFMKNIPSLTSYYVGIN